MKRVPAAAAVVAVAAVLFAQKTVPPAVDEKLPKEPVEQPIAFSHKAHVAQGMKCLDCHPIRGDGFQAGFPREAACMGCHATVKKESAQIRKLAEFAQSRKPVPWARVYTIPAYVWFSHASHFTDAKIECQACHGPVGEREVLGKERPTNMHSCMQCHAKHGASNGCDFCHNSQ
jgi:hypothetical protein